MAAEDVVRRAAIHAALGDPTRVAIVDELATSDRSPLELRRSIGIESNLLAHHLDVLAAVGVVARQRSSGDRRRRYVSLVPAALGDLVPGRRAPRPAVFVCTRNSARSQLAAALWSSITAAPAESAGTHPADRVHPGAVAAARRAGLDLSTAVPRRLADVAVGDRLVVTVCDRAHEELTPQPSWWHWSTADPLGRPTPASFDRTVSDLRRRIVAMIEAAP